MVELKYIGITEQITGDAFDVYGPLGNSEMPQSPPKRRAGV